MSIIKLYAQASCIEIKKDSKEYIFAEATSDSEEKARDLARSYLIEQISTVVSINTDRTITESDGEVSEVFVDRSQVISQLRLDGLKYSICSTSKKSTSILAYISRADLQKSSTSVADKVHQYLEVMEQKEEMGSNAITEKYTAYLYTFLTPYPISWNNVSDVQSYLQLELSSFLNKLSISCINAEVHPLFPIDHIRLNLEIYGNPSNKLNYLLKSSAYNAETTIKGNFGTLDLIMAPASMFESFDVDVSPILSVIPDDVKEVAELVQPVRHMTFSANMKEVIHISFETFSEGESVKFIPILNRVSARNFEWKKNGIPFSSESNPIVPVDFSGFVTLILNYDPDLSFSKQIGPQSSSPIQQSIQISPKPSTIKTEYNSFEELTTDLVRLKNLNQAAYGKERDFLHPENCWVFLVNPSTSLVEHALGPDKGGRFDYKTDKKIYDFKNEYKGLVAIWVEYY